MEDALSKLEEALQDAHDEIRAKDEEIEELSTALNESTEENIDLKKENSKLRVAKDLTTLDGGNKNEINSYDNAQNSNLEVNLNVPQMVVEMRKTQQLMEYIRDHLTTQSQRGIDNKEPLVLLRELSREMEFLESILGDRERVIIILNNRLQIAYHALEMTEDKYRKIRQKYRQNDGGSERSSISDLAKGDKTPRVIGLIFCVMCLYVCVCDVSMICLCMHVYIRGIHAKGVYVPFCMCALGMMCACEIRFTLAKGRNKQTNE